MKILEIGLLCLINHSKNILSSLVSFQVVDIIIKTV